MIVENFEKNRFNWKNQIYLKKSWFFQPWFVMIVPFPLDTPQTPVGGDDSMEVPESEEGTPAPSEGSRSGGKKARGGKKSVAPLKIKLNKRKKKKTTSSVSAFLPSVSASFLPLFSLVTHSTVGLLSVAHDSS